MILQIANTIEQNVGTFLEISGSESARRKNTLISSELCGH